MCPCSHANGCDGFGLGDEPVPSIADGIDDSLVVVEDTVREPVGAHVLPDVLALRQAQEGSAPVPAKAGRSS